MMERAASVPRSQSRAIHECLFWVAFSVIDVIAGSYFLVTGRDRTIRFLGIAMVGTAAAFSLDTHRPSAASGFPVGIEWQLAFHVFTAAAYRVGLSGLVFSDEASSAGPGLHAAGDSGTSCRWAPSPRAWS